MAWWVISSLHTPLSVAPDISSWIMSGFWYWVRWKEDFYLVNPIDSRQCISEELTCSHFLVSHTATEALLTELRAPFLKEVPLISLSLNWAWYLSSLFKSMCCLLPGIPLSHSTEFALFRDPVMPIKLSVFFMLTYGLCKGVHKLIWTPRQPSVLILPTCRCWSMKNTGGRRAVLKMLSQHPPLFCHSVSYPGLAKMACKDIPSCYSQTQSFILVM